MGSDKKVNSYKFPSMASSNSSSSSTTGSKNNVSVKPADQNLQVDSSSSTSNSSTSIYARVPGKLEIKDKNTFFHRTDEIKNYRERIGNEKLQNLRKLNRKNFLYAKIPLKISPVLFVISLLLGLVLLFIPPLNVALMLIGIIVSAGLLILGVVSHITTYRSSASAAKEFAVYHGMNVIFQNMLDSSNEEFNKLLIKAFSEKNVNFTNILHNIENALNNSNITKQTKDLYKNLYFKKTSNDTETSQDKLAKTLIKIMDECFTLAGKDLNKDEQKFVKQMKLNFFKRLKSDKSVLQNLVDNILDIENIKEVNSSAAFKQNSNSALLLNSLDKGVTNFIEKNSSGSRSVLSFFRSK